MSFLLLLFLILPLPSPHPILSFSMTLHVSICAWLMVQVKIKRWHHWTRRKGEPCPFQCFGHACMLYFFYVDLSLPNESVSIAMTIYWSRHVATRLSSTNQNKQKLGLMSTWMTVTGFRDLVGKRYCLHYAFWIFFWNISFRSTWQQNLYNKQPKFHEEWSVEPDLLEFYEKSFLR